MAGTAQRAPRPTPQPPVAAYGRPERPSCPAPLPPQVPGGALAAACSAAASAAAASAASAASAPGQADRPSPQSEPSPPALQIDFALLRKNVEGLSLCAGEGQSTVVTGPGGERRLAGVEALELVVYSDGALPRPSCPLQRAPLVATRSAALFQPCQLAFAAGCPRVSAATVQAPRYAQCPSASALLCGSAVRNPARQSHAAALRSTRAMNLDCLCRVHLGRRPIPPDGIRLRPCLRPGSARQLLPVRAQREVSGGRCEPETLNPIHSSPK